MLCQAIAEDEIMNLRKNEKYNEACSLGEMYHLFFPNSNALKEEIYICYLLKRDFYHANKWFNKINIDHDPDYISKQLSTRLANNKPLIQKSLLSHIPMIKVVINAVIHNQSTVGVMNDDSAIVLNDELQDVKQCILKLWSLCQDKELVFVWIIQTDVVLELTRFVDEENIPMIVVDGDCDVLHIYSTPYLLHVQDEPDQPFKISDLLSILEQEILISHINLKSVSNRNCNFFSHYSQYRKILNNTIEYGYSVAEMKNATCFSIFQTIHQTPRYKCFYINLKRRQDRMKYIQALKTIPGMPHLYRLDAIDGTNLTPTPRLQALCGNGNYAMKEGVIGCALSHLKLYTMLIEDDDVDGYVIFEDDVVAKTNFPQHLEQVLSIAQQRKNGIMFLSSVPLKCQKTTQSQYKEKGIVDRSVHHWSEIAGGTGCYYITKQTALLILKHVDQKGIHSPIDMILMFNTTCDFKPAFCLPPIVEQYDVDQHSDVQVNYNHVSHLSSEIQPSEYKIFGCNNTIDFLHHLEM